MLMPDKHVKFSESLIGLGSFVLESLDEPMSIDALWKSFKQARTEQNRNIHPLIRLKVWYWQWTYYFLLVLSNQQSWERLENAPNPTICEPSNIQNC